MTDIYTMRGLPIDNIWSIRESFGAHHGLIWDEWDMASDHIGLFRDQTIIAAFRIVHAVECRLPISDYFPDIEISADDIQVGRLTSRRNMWTKEAAVQLFAEYRLSLSKFSGTIYVATAEWGPISVKRYKSLGFENTGKTYNDLRYPYPLAVLRRSARCQD